jgi:hypothetical protein
MDAVMLTIEISSDDLTNDRLIGTLERWLENVDLSEIASGVWPLTTPQGNTIGTAVME